MTHDLYVGTDADAVLSNPTLDTIATLFQSVVRNDFPARAAAMARKAASAGRPLLVGFKEASIPTTVCRIWRLCEHAVKRSTRSC